ncbi:hypothetical protein Tco_0445389 [Tanacetum coccineum]
MNLIATQQAAFDNALVPSEKRLKIERCNARIAICPRILNQDFIAPPSEEDLVTFIQELGYSGRCNMLSAIHTDQMHQPWRTFVAIINRCISVKTTGLDRLRELRAQILWGIYNKKNVDYVALLWEDFMDQANNREIRQTISMRNKINLHIIRDDSLLGTLKFVSKKKDYQQYGALIPDDLINQDIKDSQAYKTYYGFATGKVPPRKAGKYKKVASSLRKLSPVKEAEPVKKGKRVKRPTKKSTTAPRTSVAIRDTPGVFVSKKKAPAKADRSKGIEILSDVALSESAQLKEATKTSKKDFHISQASGSGDGTDFESGVPDEQQRKTSGTNKGTGTEPGVPDVHTYDSESKNESWGDSEDDNDNDSDDNSKGNDDKANNDDDGNSDADDNKRTDLDDDDENPSFTLKYYDEEEHDEVYEFDDDNENVFEDEDDDLYKDVDVRSLGAEQGQERKGDEEMTDADQNKTDSFKQSSSISSDFASKFLILENVPLAVDEVVSMINVKSRQEESSTQAPSLFSVPMTAIPENDNVHATTVAPTISMITPPPQLMTPSTAPTTVPTTTSIPALLDFSSLFSFDQRVSTLETKMSQLKQADHSAQLLESVKSQLPTMVDDLLSTRIGYATRTALESYTKDFEKKAQEERKLYIDVVEKSSTINESLENVVLAKSSSQPKSTYEAAESLTEFELKKILLDKMERSESYKTAPEHKELYEGLVKSYNLDKDLFSSYGNVYSLKRDRDDKDKDEDPSAGSYRGLKKRKMSKDPKSSGKSVQAEELVFETTDTRMPQDQGGDTEDQPYSIDSRPPQKWISNIAKARKPPRTFNELMSTPIDFSAYVMHNLKIDNLTQEILVGPAFYLLKGTCKSIVELEYYFEECYKSVTDQLDWNNPEGHEYPFDLSTPLPLIEAQGRQVVPADYFFNKDLKYLKGGSSSRKYTTSSTKTKAAKYDNIEGIKDMVPELWSPIKHDVFSRKRIIVVTHVKVMKWYGYGYLEEIIVRKEDQTLRKFKEGDFSRLNLRDIEDLMLLLVQKKLSNLEQDVIFDLNIALRMFTIRIVILKRVEDLQLGVERYQKKLNITKSETFRYDIPKLTPYTAYKNPQGIIYLDKFKRYKLMRSDELYKFCDGTLASV